MGAVVPFIPLIATAVGLGGGAVLQNQSSKKAEGQMNAAKDAQAQQAARLEQDALRKPKVIAPENFLSNKNKMLTNMRLGLASTITGASSSPAPVLSSPALTGSGKTKLGA